MSRVGGILGRVVTGAATILGRLAQWFGLGQHGAIQPPLVAQAGRPELETPEQVVAAIAEHRLTPTPAEGARVSRSYLCTWTEEETGNIVAKTRIQVEVPQGTAAIVATTAARQGARARLPGCALQALNAGMHITMRCQQLGRPIIIPTSG